MSLNDAQIKEVDKAVGWMLDDPVIREQYGEFEYQHFVCYSDADCFERNIGYDEEVEQEEVLE